MASIPRTDTRTKRRPKFPEGIPRGLVILALILAVIGSAGVGVSLTVHIAVGGATPEK